MTSTARPITDEFKSVVGEITRIGLDWHSETLVENSKRNKPLMERSIRDLPKAVGEKMNSAVIVSAGPSLYKNNVLPRLKALDYKGTVVAVDGSLVRCIKAGIRPDFVLTLDPHPTRMVRWFGDPNFEEHSAGDDYFRRQDLDVAFRNNSIEENLKNIDLVNRHSSETSLVICSTAPEKLVVRVREAGFPMYWWAPLVDDPSQAGSLTKRMTDATGLPAMNTGGTVGTAAWIFAAAVLGIPRVGVLGMDLGYYGTDTSFRLTQTYYSLKERVGEENLPKYFPEITFPPTGEKFFTDPTYYWYRQNLLDLVSASGMTLYNCTGAGTLFGPGIECLSLEEFVKN